jgi:hypothetical protein
MLQGIRASPLTVPSFGHNMSLGNVKMENYGDVDPWTWSPHPSNSTQNYSQIFDHSLYGVASQAPQSYQPRHYSIPNSHVVNLVAPRQSHTTTPGPPSPRQQVASNVLKAHQPVFKATWHGFLDTTHDAMTVVEAALQGRLSHISRRPHDKERAEMLTSGTVLVYEENASGIKRWTDAVHWSPSRVMNNCLIYRQLVRALKPEEKKAALNPACGTKRKRKGSASPSVTNSGDSINNAEDEYEYPSLDSAPGDATSTDGFGKVYANFAQSLTPDQQRRYCGSLVDSYEFKEGGLMKKTISVKYQGTHHHVISYYSLEDAVKGKLKRPCQDARLSGIQPRPELLTGWKVSLEDEESKDMPLLAGYSQQLQPSHIQHSAIGSIPHGVAAPGPVRDQPQLQLQVPTHYWHDGNIQQYSSTHHSPQHYASPQHTISPYTPQAIPTYPPQQSPAQQYSHGLAQEYPIQQHSASHYQPNSQLTPQYTSSSQTTQDYAQKQQRNAPQQYLHHTATSAFTEPQQAPVVSQSQYTISQAPSFEVSAPLSHSRSPAPQATHSPIQHHDPHRRSSAPVAVATYGLAHPQPQYQAALQPPTYYVNQKYAPEPAYSY